jgi:hypothetical protein
VLLCKIFLSVRLPLCLRFILCLATLFAESCVQLDVHAHPSEYANRLRSSAKLVMLKASTTGHNAHPILTRPVLTRRM